AGTVLHDHFSPYNMEVTVDKKSASLALRAFFPLSHPFLDVSTGFSLCLITVTEYAIWEGKLSKLTKSVAKFTKSAVEGVGGLQD
ncbi:MAG: hypothetical protein IKQ59_04070, partial [Prevotella sp.]|nr:hypothetical protein [Prevotella sp.]